jgi:hypothetical protein
MRRFRGWFRACEVVDELDALILVRIVVCVGAA